ncbi:MAG: hypothetical protein ACOWWH_10825 [Eubacteriaceae bacterium]
MNIKSEKLKYWDDLVGTEGFIDEDTSIMKKSWDEVEDSLFIFVMGLLV